MTTALLRSGLAGFLLCSTAALAACSAAPEDGTDQGGQGGAASGGGTGSGGATGSGGSTSLTLVEPIERDGQLVLEFGDTYFAVDPEVGGRIVGFGLDAASNLLTDSSVNGEYWGSTFWTSPQSEFWPPPPAMETEPYTPTVAAPSLTLVSSQVDYLGKSIVVTKKFTADLVAEAIDIVYTMKNVGTADASVAGWEVARVRPGGLSFFPTGDAAVTPDGSGPLAVDQALDVTWFDSAAHPPDGTGRKLNADGKEGWLAHVEDGVLFLKLFTDLPTSAQVPGDGEVELYYSPDSEPNGYVELENQGATGAIAPGASKDFSIRWLVRQLPSNVTVEVGSESLLAYVRSLL